MEDIKASNGNVVTEKMLDGVCAALDSDKWPEGWCNAGDVADRLPMSPKRSAERTTLKPGFSQTDTQA